MILLLSLLAFNVDNVLTSDVSEPNGCDQDRPASRSMYTTISYRDLRAQMEPKWMCRDQPTIYQWMLPGSNVEINLQREWLISTEYNVLASDVWWQNLLLSKFKVKTICIDVAEVIIVPWLRGEAVQGYKQSISSNQTIN